MDIRPYQVVPSPEVAHQMSYQTPYQTPTTPTYQMPEQTYYQVPQQTYYTTPEQETPAVQKYIQERKPVLPNYDTQTQMSPFGDDRWDLDVEENRRRKEIHREYVYKNSRSLPKPAPEQTLIRPEEPQSVYSSPRAPREVPPEIETSPKESPKNDFLTPKEPILPKPKTLADLTFEPAKPPNLFPILKFPEKNFPVRCPQEILPIEKSGVNHYGTQVPFWRFD